MNEIRTLAEARAGRVTVTVEEPCFDRDEVVVKMTFENSRIDLNPKAAVNALAENYQRAGEKIAELEQKLTHIRSAVWASALDQVIENRGARTGTARAVAVVRSIVGQPDGPYRLSDQLYTSEEVGDLQASEAELVAAPLRDQISALKHRIISLDERRLRESADFERRIQDWQVLIQDDAKSALARIAATVHTDRIGDHMVSPGAGKDYQVLVETINEIRDIIAPWGSPASPTDDSDSV